MEEVTKIIIENVPVELKSRFKSRCAIQDVAMSKKGIELIEEFLKNYNENL